MFLQKCILVMLVVLIPGTVTSRIIKLDVSSYSSGRIAIPNSLHEALNDINKWHLDTILFSTGSKISFMELNQGVTGGYIGCGGLVVIDTSTIVSYKNYDILVRKLGGTSDNQKLGSFTYTTKSSDTLWNKALLYPDRLFPADTFVYATSWLEQRPISSQAKHLYTHTRPVLVPHVSAVIGQNTNSIMYLKSKKDGPQNKQYKIKIQIESVKFLSSPDAFDTCTRVDSIIFRWAADDRNNIFKIDPTVVSFAENETIGSRSAFTVSYLDRKIYLSLKDIPGEPTQISASIYNCRGTRIVKMQGHISRRIELPHIPAGIYFATITAPGMCLHHSFRVNGK